MFATITRAVAGFQPTFPSMGTLIRSLGPERLFDHRDKSDWMLQNWHWSIYIVLAYLTLIYVGQLWMRDRKKFEFRHALTLWNLGLAIFSIRGTLWVVPELIMLLQAKDKGFHHTICSVEYMSRSPDSRYWAWVFTLSKVIELGDTAFVVLRKQPLSFLHWYHHTTVLLFTWYSHSPYISTSRWFCTMNFLVHSLMYTYYTLKSLRISVPKTVAMAITILQLSQMVVGVAVNVVAAFTLTQGGICDVSWRHIQLGLGMYATYFLLFIHFFYRAYFSKRTLVSRSKKSG